MPYYQLQAEWTTDDQNVRYTRDEFVRRLDLPMTFLIQNGIAPGTLEHKALTSVPFGNLDVILNGAPN